MKNRGIACLSFTEQGWNLARRICALCGGDCACTRDGIRLRAWTAARFPTAQALLYIGAAGIAIRAVAPYLTDKTRDPAVLCVDEGGRFVIPLLSGHLGGANALARQIADAIGAVAVVTTATDGRGVFAVDEWARLQGCAVVGAAQIKDVSGALLAGKIVRFRSAFPIGGARPEGVALIEDGDAAVWVDVRPHAGLVVAPRCLTLGVGCRRGTSRETLERRFDAFCAANRILPEAVSEAATIELKKDEPGLLTFCASHGWALRAFSATALSRAPGNFAASAFVRAVVGVDNVCERAAVLASGGTLTVRKDAGEGVTFAIAQRTVPLDWRWQDG